MHDEQSSGPAERPGETTAGADPHSFTIEIPGRDPVLCRMPWAPTVARLQALLGETAGDVEAEWLAWGAAIGVLRDGVPGPSKGQKLAEYGEAVLGDMHAQGWTLRDLTRLRISVARHLRDEIHIDPEEVKQRLGFS
jgi:hypothetical protein